MSRIFSAVIEDPPKPSGVLDTAMWAIVHLSDGSTHLVAYSDALKKTVDATWSPAGGGTPLFVQAKDGWLYGVFREPVSPFKYRKIKRFRVNATGTAVATVEDIMDFPSGKRLAGGAGFSESVFIDPDGGTIYFKTSTDPQDFDVEPEGSEYLRLRKVGVSWVLDTIEVVTEARPSWSDFAPDGTHYKVTTVTQSIKRRFKPCVLGDGRWMAADFMLDATWSEHEVLNGDVTGQCRIGNFDPPCSGGVYQSTAIRCWGNAWWEKASAAAAWVANVNGGVTSENRGLALDIFSLLVMEGAAPSSFKNVRVTHGATAHLPLVSLVKGFGAGQGFESGVPVQSEGTLYADAVNLYLMMHGDRNDDDSLFSPLGIYKAAIPSAGGVPTWTQIVAEPDLDASPVLQWDHYVVPSVKYIWVPEHNFTNNTKKLLAYTKTGGGPTVVRSDTEIAQTQGVMHLTTGWQARWK